MNTTEQAEQLARDVMTEHQPLTTHEKWQSLLRLVSRMSTDSAKSPYDRKLLNTAYTVIKQKYREFERSRSFTMPKLGANK